MKTMKFSDLLIKYKEGEADQAERELIENEIEKYQAIEEYFLDRIEEEFKDKLEIADEKINSEETFKLKKNLKNRLTKMTLISAGLVMGIFIIIWGVLSPIVDNLYYRPDKIGVSNTWDDLSYDISVLSQLTMPGLAVSNAYIDKEGFANYSIAYNYLNTFTKESYRVNNIIKRGRITYTDKDIIHNKPNFNYISYYKEDKLNDRIQKEATIDYLQKLNPLSYVSVDLIFEEDMDMEELHKMEANYPDVEFKWAGVRSGPVIQREDTTSLLRNQVIGINLMDNQSILLGDKKITEDYPGLFIFDWLVNPVGYEDGQVSLVGQAYEKHYVSLLRYLIQRQEFLEVFMPGRNLEEVYASALKYAEENGVKTYGVLVYAEAEELIDLLSNEDIKHISINQVLASKFN